MPDREKVIKGLEYCMKNQHCSDCESCAYGGVTSVICNSLIKDALELLKEQEEEIKHLRLALGIMKGEGIVVNLNEVDDDKH